MANLQEFSNRQFKKGETLTALNYIKRLSSQSGQPITDWDIDETFATNNGELDFNPQELNKRFFTRLKQSNKLGVISVDFSKEVEKDIAALEAKINQSKISEYEKNRDQIIQGIRSHATQIESYQKSLQTINHQILGASNKIDFKKEIERILKIGLFKLEKIGPTIQQHPEMIFSTEPINLKFKRKDGLKIDLPMGTYGVLFHPTIHRIYVRPLKNNISLSGYSHPYISNDHAICWGSASETVSRAMAEGRFGEVFILLASLLTTYDADTSPYRALEEFYTKGTLGNGLAPWREGLDIGETDEEEEEEEYEDEDSDAERGF